MAHRRWRKRETSHAESGEFHSPKCDFQETSSVHRNQSAVTQPEKLSSDGMSIRKVFISTDEKPQTLGIVWYKWSDLRVKDHEPLLRAHGMVGMVGCDEVIHLHIVELPYLTGKARLSGLPRCSRQRARFWKESVQDLAMKFEESHRSLLVRAGEDAADVLASVIEEFEFLEKYSTITVYTHCDFCTEELTTEKRVRKRLAKLSSLADTRVELATAWGALTVHHIDDLGFDPRSPDMPEFKGEFNRIAKRRPLRQVLEPPARFRPAPPQCRFAQNEVGSAAQQVESIFALHEEAAQKLETDDRIELILPLETTKCLSLESIETNTYGRSFVDGSFEWRGGESAAQSYLDTYFGQRNKFNDGIGKGQPRLWSYRGATESFAHGEEINALFSGTRLSSWLAFGCISAREIVHRARECERRTGKKGGGKSVGKAGSTGARLHTELLFRDFLRLSALKWGPALFHQNGPFNLGQTPAESIPWRNLSNSLPLETTESNHVQLPPSTLFRRWRLGQTGFPFVDAGMRQLLHTGYMSHLHRQCCAAFLARDLKLDWRLGAEHFESCLVDYTPDANWGNWAYRILQRPGLAKSRNETMYSGMDLKEMGFFGTGLLGDSAKAGHVAGPPANNVAAGSAPLAKDVKLGSLGTPKDSRGACRVADAHLSTIECIAWPIVHDCKMQHTLTWVPELAPLPRDLAREPWRVKGGSGCAEQHFAKFRKVDVHPYKDSPLWFCAANRTNWNYEYWWLPGGAWLAPEGDDLTLSNGGKKKWGLNSQYPPPLVRPLNLEIRLSQLPIRNHVWGDTPQKERPHVRD